MAPLHGTIGAIEVALSAAALDNRWVAIVEEAHAENRP